MNEQDKELALRIAKTIPTTGDGYFCEADLIASAHRYHTAKLEQYGKGFDEWESGQPSVPFPRLEAAYQAGAASREAEVVALREENVSLRAQLAQALAKIDAAGKQEPVAHQFQDPTGRWHNFVDDRHYAETLKDGSWPIRDLFTAPPITTAGECVWSPDSDEESDVWSGSCGATWILLKGGPEENGIKFCPQCGKPVTTTPRGTEKEE